MVRTTRLVLVGLLTVVVGGMVVARAVGEEPSGHPGPPARNDPGVPSEREDMGRGERLVLVVGGVLDSRSEADEGAAILSFGEFQGYYVARVSQFEGLAEEIGAREDQYVLVSGFRTQVGAREFAELAGSFGHPATITSRVRNLGGEYVGLGQESDPAGTGPLHRPTEASEG